MGWGDLAAQGAVGKHSGREKFDGYRIRGVERISTRSSSVKELNLWFWGKEEFFLRKN